MSDTAFAHSSDDVSSLERPRAFDTILYGGLVAGTLDILYAVIASGLRGRSPTGVLQYVASGLLGRDSFSGGWKTAVLGLILHFLIAFVIAATYYSASLILPTLIRQAVVWGLVYGVAVYFVMNYVVLPLSAVPRIPFSFVTFISGLLVHALLVGLPIALFARRSAKAN